MNTGFDINSLSRFSLAPLVAVAALCAGGCRSLTEDSATDELISARRGAAELALQAPALAQSGEKPGPSPDLPMRYTGALELQQAVDLALENNLALRGAYLRRSEALGLVEEAVGEAMPALEMDGSAVSDLRKRDDTPETYSLGLRLSQPLWRSGIIAAGLRYAQLNAAKTDAAIREQVQRTIAEVVKLYLDVLLQQHLVTVYEEASGTAERMLTTSRSRRTAGTVSDYEVLRAEVEVSTANADLLQARNTLRTSTLELLRTLGISQDSEVELSEALAFSPELFDDEEAVRSAFEHRPDLFQAEAGLRMAEESVEIIRGQYGPAVDAFLRGVYANPDPNSRVREKNWGDDWSIGATLKWTLLDGSKQRGRVRQALSKVGQAANALRDAEEAARVEVVKALLDLRHADELYHSQSKNLELAREALRMLESGFRMGRNTQVEVLDAQSALTDAMGRYYNAVHMHSMSRLRMRQAMGILGAEATRLTTSPEGEL